MLLKNKTLKFALNGQKFATSRSLRVGAENALTVSLEVSGGEACAKFVLVCFLGIDNIASCT